MDYQLTKEELRSLKPDRNFFKNLKRFPIISILYNPNSLFNVGVIIRTCEAFRIEEVIIISESGINLESKKIKKTSMGSLKWINVKIKNNILDVINELKQQNYSIIAVELTKNSKNYKQVKYSYPVAFIFGNEVNGLPDEIINKCDFSIHINMYGMANSLNVAVCNGIIVANAIEKFRLI